MIDHPSIPKTLTKEALAQWLEDHAKEQFSEPRRYLYTEEELLDLKDQAVSAGIEIQRLEKLKKHVSDLVEKGSEKDLNFDFVSTKGTKKMKLLRETCEQRVEKGYWEETIQIYGIPNPETRTMDFFDIEGNQVYERARALTTSEEQEFLSPLFDMQRQA